MEKIVEVGMPAEQVESLMQVKLSQVRIELQTHFEAEVAIVLQKHQGLCLEKEALKAEIELSSQNYFLEHKLPQAQAQLRCMKKRSKLCSKK